MRAAGCGRTSRPRRARPTRIRRLPSGSRTWASTPRGSSRRRQPARLRLSGTSAASREVLAQAPDDAPANFSVGRLLLAQGKDEGLRHLERAMVDPEAVLPACELAVEFLEQRGREEEAEPFRERAKRQLEQFEAAAEERAGVGVDDRFLPPELAPEHLERIRSVVARTPEVGQAFLARKHVQHLADAYPYYVLVVVPRRVWRRAWREADNDPTPLDAPGAGQ